MKNLLVSFSGGETSAFMAQWLNNHYEELGYENIVFVFANTGIENEQTLEFVDKCDKYFKLCVQWIEADVIHGKRIGSKHYVTNFENASRYGEPFEQVIKKYGIPNIKNPHCTRELKANPIKSFGGQWFQGDKYDTAIGIRLDEIDRVSAYAEKNRFIYPLVQQNMIPSTKQKVNFYWKNMPFRLELKGYQGNCATCWKKSDKKLYQIAQENPKSFDFMKKMENKYGNSISSIRMKKYAENGNEAPKNITFFRKNRSADQIISESIHWKGIIKNDSEDYNYQIDLLGGESCEPFGECGS